MASEPSRDRDVGKRISFAMTSVMTSGAPGTTILLSPARGGSLRRPPAVDHQGRARHEGRLIRGEIERGIGDLLRLAHPADRLAGVQLAAHLVFLPGKVAGQVAFDKGGMHGPGTDR